MSHILQAIGARAGVLSLVLAGAVQPAFADALDFLNGQVFLPEGGCTAAADPAQPFEYQDLPGNFVLVGADGGRHFAATRWPGVCNIDAILAPSMYGAGNGFATVMTALSCIDDTAVPRFEIVVLESQPESDGSPARVNVYALNDAESDLAGSYTACEGPARQRVEDLYLRGISDNPG